MSQTAIERINPADVWEIPLLPIINMRASTRAEARGLAASLLVEAGVAPPVVEGALQLLLQGPGPGGTVMRGAMLLDAETGRRLEADQLRGVRVTRVDVRSEIRAGWVAGLERTRLGHHRILEALLLASKVAAAGTVAEIGWSDDPAYTTGYVAAPGLGYVRIPHMKEAGDPKGGRAYFVRGESDPAVLTRILQERPARVGGPLRIVAR